MYFYKTAYMYVNRTNWSYHSVMKQSLVGEQSFPQDSFSDT